MPDLPAMLRVAGRRCIIVGGGPVAQRRAQALLFAGAIVTVIAPEVEPELAALPIQILKRPYREDDLEDAFMVVVATNDPVANHTIMQEAQFRHVLVNRCDDPSLGNVSIPAHAFHGPVSIAVETNGISPAAAAAIRREISEALDPDWPRFLDAIAPFRAQIQARIPDTGVRLERLRELGSSNTLQLFRTRGMEALLEYCRDLVKRPV